MNDTNDSNFETHVRSQLSAIVLIVNNIHRELDTVGRNSEKVLMSTESLDKSYSALIPIQAQLASNVKEQTESLKTVVTQFTASLTASQKETAEAYKSSSDKIDKWTVMLMLASIMGVTAMFMGYTMTTGFAQLNRTLIEIRQADDQRVERTAEKTAEKLGDVIKTDQGAEIKR